jgi:hypothetical protein
MNYSRPEMLPCDFTGMTGIPNFTLPGFDYAVSGNRASMMQMMFNLDQLTIRARWSLSYSFPPSPTLFYSSFDYTLDCKNLPTTLPCQTSYGYYYTTTTGSPPYPVWADPASRVLGPHDGAKPMPNAGVTYDVANSKSLSVQFRPSFTGVAPSTSALQVACEIIAVDFGQQISTNMTGAVGGTLLATTSLSIFGMTFPVYLAINSGGPVSATFSIPFTVTGSTAFHS